MQARKGEFLVHLTPSIFRLIMDSIIYFVMGMFILGMFILALVIGYYLVIKSIVSETNWATIKADEDDSRQHLDVILDKEV